MTSVVDTARKHKREYAGDADRPLGSYLGTMAVYAVTAGTLALLAQRRRNRTGDAALPWVLRAVRTAGRAARGRRTGRTGHVIGLGDLALMTITTHKLSRLIAKDPVTSPLRAPFTRYEGTSGPSELAEEVRGSGVRHAVGELITCPFCTAQWVATGYAAGLMLAPRATRAVGATMTAVAGSDWLQLAYARLQQAAEG
ncbi:MULTISPECIES: DUF1360 domain-containing protein [Actinomadura]|uniref:DUF1360 domain-containing protein n=1 Tax=Actinomadura miaoliensis TaxID=430685 RepID=A0ABP7W6L9_9ACTN